MVERKGGCGVVGSSREEYFITDPVENCHCMWLNKQKSKPTFSQLYLSLPWMLGLITDNPMNYRWSFPTTWSGNQKKGALWWEKRKAKEMQEDLEGAREPESPTLVLLCFQGLEVLQWFRVFLLAEVILNLFSFACYQNSLPVQTWSGKVLPWVSNDFSF